MNDFFIISVFALFIIYVASIYNRVIRKKNEAGKAFGTVEILLKKRYDLLPNLVDIVKQYSIFEASVFLELSKLTNQISLSASDEEKILLHNQMNKNINGIIVNVLNQPEFKSSQHYLRLQASWNETEEQISAARRYYNAAVNEYNNSIQTFPANILMNKNSYAAKNFLEFSEEEKDNVSARKLFKGE